MDSLLPENNEFWRIDAAPLKFLFEHRHSYLSCNADRRAYNSVLLHPSCGHFFNDASRLSRDTEAELKLMGFAWQDVVWKPKVELAGELLSMAYAPPGAMGLSK